jgi:hypothetical protein
MKYLFTSRVARLASVVAVAAVLAPAAHATGGAVGHTYAPPPLDAGSAVPNPDYFPEVNRSLESSVQRPDDRASWATVHGVQVSGAGQVGAQSNDDGFNWADGGIGAAGAFTVVLLAIGSAAAVRRNRHRTASV